ncbi:hypothetical protein TNIN_175211, partial [Trichonephila inaurata madagascariensis]
MQLQDSRRRTSGDPNSQISYVGMSTVIHKNGNNVNCIPK